MAYLENVGRSILTWELAATCTCRRNEETGSQSKGKGVWNFWERRTGWGIQAWVLGGNILRVTFPEGLPAPLFYLTQSDMHFLRSEKLSLDPWHLLLSSACLLDPVPVRGVSLPHLSLSDLPSTCPMSLLSSLDTSWDSSLFFSSYETYTLSTYVNYICVCLCIVYKTIYKYTCTYMHFISQAL